MSKIVTIKEVQAAASRLWQDMRVPAPTRCNIYGVPRGGIPAALALSVASSGWLVVVDNPEEASIIVDDIIDSGATQRRYKTMYPDKEFVALFNKPSEYLIFPWELNLESSAGDIPTRLLQFIGEDPERGGLVETPKRFLKAWEYLTSGYGKNPAKVLKVFTDGAEKCDELVLVKNIPIYSVCEHHLVPFFGVAHIGYIPDGKIVGLSKLSRVADIFAKRLQVQERLTGQIADALEEHLEPKGVAVTVECRHLCMESRGICQQGSTTITSAMRGLFREYSSARNEYLSLIK